MNKKIGFILALVVISLVMLGTVSAGFFDFLNFGNDKASDVKVVEDGQYCTVDEVSAYIKEFHKLPSNYITKKEAQSLGWHGGPLKKYAPGKSIGGDESNGVIHIHFCQIIAIAESIRPYCFNSVRYGEFATFSCGENNKRYNLAIVF